MINSTIKYHASYAVVFYILYRVFYGLIMVCVASLRVARRATHSGQRDVKAVGGWGLGLLNSPMAST